MQNALTYLFILFLAVLTNPLSAQQNIISTSPNYASGSTAAFLQCTFKDVDNIKEYGLLWGQDSENYQYKKEFPRPQSSRKLMHIDDLKPETIYFIKSYAKTSTGINYGNEVKIKTIAEGKITFSILKPDTLNEKEKRIYARIEKAFSKATSYFNTYTSITKHLTVHYNPSVPTADGNINGNIRIGANPAYQKTGTAMHEICHALGVGQHKFWKENISSGKWNGMNANTIIKFLSRGELKALKGDNLHFWPYGINGAHEDTQEFLLYASNALVIQALNLDGLPSKQN